MFMGLPQETATALFEKCEVIWNLIMILNGPKETKRSGNF